MMKTQAILDGMGTISIDDFEGVLNELVERWEAYDSEDLISNLKRYIGLFDEDVLRIYNDTYKVSKRWYDSCRQDYDEAKSDNHGTQDEINNAALEVDNAKRDINEMRKLPRSLTEMSEDDYNWLMSQLSQIDNDWSTKTLDEVDMDNAYSSSLDENLLIAFLKLSNADRQVVLNKEY